MRHFKSIILLSFMMTSTGCALTSGLQTYDLPKEGVYQTELGTRVNVLKLTQSSLPATQTAQYHQDYFSHLFHATQKTYKLSAGDVLSIYLWAYPEISGSEGYQIDQSGYIQFPIVGRYKAAGKSLTQVNQELRTQLGRYLKTPDVVARVLSYQGQRYSVQGNVMKGGQFNLTDQPTSVYTALGLAGGINTQSGDNTSITLVRQGKTYNLNSISLEKAGYSLHNLLIQPNDTLYVNSKDNQKIYVMGESGQNKPIPMRDQGISLSDVIGESLGLNPLSGSRSKIYVVRSHPTAGMTDIYHLDLTSIGDFGLANKFQMRSNDIVYIDASGLTRWQRVLNQVIPFSNVIYNIERLGQ
ncbi:polysaccharide biosynthesis/export family protein [Acinetobacter johnsonii]|uniref:polysaccharide biosynthesis/export family protein n=1 Tax=Acinetobacter johnsonii TaxID=40214 RepID=UPI0032B3CC61